MAARTQWARMSVVTGLGALLCAAIVFLMGSIPFAGNPVGFFTVVYSFLGMGAVAGVGLAFAVIAFFRSRQRIRVAVAGLVLNLLLLAIGSCFLIFFPTR